ncbi:hypothetical protein [Alicyclobacillus sp. ALC3]|uniref:hypothetical protein n=1 Tax=Alicyclobacillus sp. ALC3 TaxID=2796143 RepID=UPI002379D238|nr:hypothetical protein [Alicyclobacillus sp. ALC3]WDL97603.1 hypothetical protein JC200_02405 [Alicyclobacillus sp. ALC3]
MQNSTPRRSRVTVGPFSINQLHFSNPWVVAFWSVFFPGFGQITLGQYLLGWILFGWEVLVNLRSHFNTAIVYTLTGRVDAARYLLDMKWILLYGSVFTFAFWSSYQLSVETNIQYYLANRENAPVKIFEMNAIQYDFLDKRKPIVAALWSLLMPGLGALYNRRLPSAVSALAWWILICYKSHMALAVYFTFYGQFQRATSVLNPEWTLFLPSIFAFTFYNSYVTAVDRNTLYDKELTNFLQSNYQPENFNFDLGR